MIKKSRVKSTQVPIFIFVAICLFFTVPIYSPLPTSLSAAIAKETAKSTGMEALVVTPAIAKLGSSVEILGAGFVPGAKLYIYIAPEPVFGWKSSEKTEAIMLRLKPESMPTVNIGGGFSASFKTRGIRRAGVYCLEARTKEGQILATAPLKLTK